MTAPRLLLSSTATVHVDGCPTMSHVIDGQAPRVAWSWERTMTRLPDPEVVLLPEEHLEPAYIVRDDEQRVDRSVDLTTTLDALAVRTAAYTRCTVCCPDVPPFTPPVRTTLKRAGSLDSHDIGRRSTLGVVASVHHTTRIRFDDGSGIEIDSNEPIEFFRRSSSNPSGAQA